MTCDKVFDYQMIVLRCNIAA